MPRTLAKYFKVEKVAYCRPSLQPSKTSYNGQINHYHKKNSSRKARKLKSLHVLVPDTTVTPHIKVPSQLTEKHLPESTDFKARNDQKLRAEALLKKLRNRKIPASVQKDHKYTSAASTPDTPINSKQSETREIQECVKFRRMGIEISQVLPSPSPQSLSGKYSQTTGHFQRFDDQPTEYHLPVINIARV